MTKFRGKSPALVSRCQALAGTAPGRLLLVLLVLATLAGCDSGGGDKQQARQQEPPPPAVSFQKVTPETVSVEAEYTGRAHGSREVQVRSRVAGILEERLYHEGQAVEQGAALFRIDPEPFEIAQQQAKARLATAEAELAHARREWRRYSTLYEDDAISQRERDQAQTNLQLAQARLALAEADLADARRNLRYTEVSAPAAGRTGLESLSEGSLVEVGSLLTTITSLDPLHLRFALAEPDAALLARRQDTRDDVSKPLTVSVRLADGSTYPHPGEIDFTDRVVDPATGTVTVRAILPNPDGVLLPGQLLRLRLRLQQLNDVFRVPPQAIDNNRQGPRVFIIDDDDRAHSRPVELGPRVDGRQVILSGLAAGDKLVVNGQVALADGAPVTPMAAEE
ncbi:MAG: efflux RND transporter periplasmic adaptor subunit [Desulfurivibrio sp.]|nr:efflux RND transporter periplasmic adaptor subunit [Desulfurivibrio sp.]